MKKKLMEEMMKKGKEKKTDNKMAGKMCALKELHKVASEMMGHEMSEDSDSEEMKKVTVAAKDDKGLQDGLKKAKELLSKKS